MSESVKDACTLFPDTIGNINITHCCEAHDNAYALQTGKWEADVELFKCVKEAYPSGGMFLIAALMFAGVSLGGWLWYVRGGKR